MSSGGFSVSIPASPTSFCTVLRPSFRFACAVAGSAGYDGILFFCMEDARC